VQCLFCCHGMTVQEFAELISDDGSVEACPECNRQAVARHQWKDREPTYECFCCGYFRGPELKWTDGKAEIPGFTIVRKPRSVPNSTLLNYLTGLRKARRCPAGAFSPVPRSPAPGNQSNILSYDEYIAF